MLFGSYELLLENPAAFVRLAVLVVLALLVAITVHEFSHALLATLLGDGTARRLGRLSLNPLRHLDPTGTVLILVAGFGWGKPVPVNHHRLAQGAVGMSLVAAAGPLSNLVVAFLVAIPIKMGILTWTSPSLTRATLVMSGGLQQGLSDVAALVIFFNLLLGIFNLIPLAPLDGSKVLGGLMPRDSAASYERFQQYGPVILITVVLGDAVFGLGILARIIGPIVRALITAATGF